MSYLAFFFLPLIRSKHHRSNGVPRNKLFYRAPTKKVMQSIGSSSSLPQNPIIHQSKRNVETEGGV